MVKEMKKMWTGVCDVSRLVQEENPDTYIMEQKEEILFEKLPCFFIQKSKVASDDGVSRIFSYGTLIVEADKEVEEGSRIVITQNGKKEEYAFCGFPKIYESHREIPITLLRRWTDNAE